MIGRYNPAALTGSSDVKIIQAKKCHADGIVALWREFADYHPLMNRIVIGAQDG